MKAAMIFMLVFFCADPGFAATTAAELNNQCSAMLQKPSVDDAVDRAADSGFCLGYMNAVLDSIENSHDIVIVKNFIVGDMIGTFRPYAAQHYAERADAAVINAMIASGFLKRLK